MRPHEGNRLVHLFHSLTSDRATAYLGQGASVLGRFLYRLPADAQPVPALLLALGGWRALAQGGIERRFAAFLLTGLGVYLVSFATVWYDPRLGSQLLCWVLPLTGAGAVALLAWLARRWPRPEWWFAAALVLSLLPVTARPRRHDKLPLLDAAERVAREIRPGERLLATDRRIAFYAGAEVRRHAVAVKAGKRRAGLEVRVAEIARRIARGEVDLVVLEGPEAELLMDSPRLEALARFGSSETMQLFVCRVRAR